MSRTETAGPDAASRPSEREGRLRSMRTRFRALPGGWVAWRVVVSIVGVSIIVGGIILLPLPGPGWLIIFAGLGILATEYEWASRLLRFARETLKHWTTWQGRQPLWLRAIFGLLTAAVIVLAVWVVWQLYR